LKKGKIALKLDDGDSLIDVQRITDDQDIMIVTANGQAIRINAKKVRQMGRVSRGVKGITLSPDDYVVGMEVVDESKKILTVTENGIGKISKSTEFNVINRGGKGVKVAKVTKKTGKIVAVKSITGNEDLMIMTDQGIIIRIDISTISTLGRTATGVKVINLVDDQKVATVTLAEKEENYEEFLQNNRLSVRNCLLVLKGIVITGSIVYIISRRILKHEHAQNIRFTPYHRQASWPAST